MTVRNASERAMEARVEGRLEGSGPLGSSTLRLGPGGARELAWDVTVPPGTRTLAYEIEARQSGGASDRLRVTQNILIYAWSRRCPSRSP